MPKTKSRFWIQTSTHNNDFFLQKILMFLKKWCNKQHDIGPCNELTGDRSAMDNMCMVITCIFDGCCTSVGPNTYLGNTKSRREMNAIFTTMAGERILHIPRTSNLSASMEELAIDAAIAAVGQGHLQSRNRQVYALCWKARPSRWAPCPFQISGGTG